MTTVSVLYVEDDEDEFFILNELSKRANSYEEDCIFELTLEKDFTEGLIKYISGNFDICLLDYQLGERNAHEFLSSIRLYMNKIPIIILTGHDDISLDISLMEQGVRAYLPKEYMSARLLERTIRYVLEQFNNPVYSHVSRLWNSTVKKNILCIEDDIDDFEILRLNLLNIKTASYNIKHVTTLQEGLEEYLGKTHYDACLLDYKLGKENALEILYSLGKDTHRTPIIMLTDYNDLSLDRFSMELGIKGFLSKTDITTSQLERILRYVIYYSGKVV